METAVFKSYENGFYTFWFDNGGEIMFDDALPKVLAKYDLKNDSSLLDTEFYITFTEKFDKSDENVVIYTIMSLKPLYE
ncbi:hypothetical protein MWU58_00615 [Flavobacteriaceae bacterium S0825]|uniref:hypothetical protein n=1 Tax=Gaetbulibacter sp. S0825 TaxID=2720084 RepID=UPI001430E120|nr:hypothetical protein [Gaetbulibacter sp. S0825]MCK0107782.1 hypothetical protein [Flavobacteriaceae bacterium S0825]NIX63418.1 hypothetical protein [Gaetbulibacter sp. S0825]